jgi:hypothetical protein
MKRNNDVFHPSQELSAAISREAQIDVLYPEILGDRAVTQFRAILKGIVYPSATENLRHIENIRDDIGQYRAGDSEDQLPAFYRSFTEDEMRELYRLLDEETVRLGALARREQQDLNDAKTVDQLIDFHHDAHLLTTKEQFEGQPYILVEGKKYYYDFQGFKPGDYIHADSIPATVPNRDRSVVWVFGGWTKGHEAPAVQLVALHSYTLVENMKKQYAGDQDALYDVFEKLKDSGEYLSINISLEELKRIRESTSELPEN